MNGLTAKEMIETLIKSGLTQVDVQKLTGISQPSISRILSGKNSDPRLSVIRAIEKAYLFVGKEGSSSNVEA